MRTTTRVCLYETRDVARGKWLPAYAGFLLVLAWALTWLGGDGRRALAGMVNAVLVVVPLVSLLFGTLYLYGARDFTRLLLAQPVGRGALFRGLWLGLALPLGTATAAGLALPLVPSAIHDPSLIPALLGFVGVATLLSLAFLSVAFLVATCVRDRAAGMGVAILAWVALTILYDGLLLLGATAFSRWPLERPALVLTLLNPVDLARVLLLMQFDSAAMLGYTGAVFERFLGSGLGAATAAVALGAWTLLPLLAAARVFAHRDL